MIRFLYIDLFCGAGGTSTGVEAARLHGEQVAKVIACVNHDANAIASHAANHPDALHFVEDIRTLNLDRLLAHVEVSRKQYPAARVVLWASLECTNFSIAKGGQSRDADSRTLAEHLFRYIDALRPDYIQIENVKEFMTLFSADLDCTRIVCGAAIVYENGAKVNTSFLSNMFGEAGVIGDPVLYEGIDAICSAPKAELPKYKYPDCVLTVSDVAYIVKNKGEIKIDKREMVHHSALDIQKKHGKSIYGSGFLISYTAAERVTAERAAVKKEAIVWELSEREMRIVEKLSGQ